MTGKDDTGLIEDESNMTSGPSDRLQALENTKGLTGAWKNRRDMRAIMPRFIAFAELRRFSLMVGIETIVTAVTAVAY